jgi:hypothetical protein
MINVVKEYKYLAIAILMVLVSLMGYFIYCAISQSKNNATIDVLIAPSGSKVKLNGHGIRVGKIKVKSGEYTINAYKNGFTDGEVKVSVKVGETRFAGLILEPNDPSTKSWYDNHPEDASLADGIVGQRLGQDSADAVAENPLISKLPFLGPSLEYRIDYGISAEGKDNPAIYIRAISPQARENAINWIKKQGFDPGKMEIIYSAELPN